jgi:hypothetical protein
MSEINIEIEKHRALDLLPDRQVLKCLRNGVVKDVALESVVLILQRADQVGINAMGTAHSMGLALWAKHRTGGFVFIETNLDAVDGLSLSLGLELPN